MTQNKLYRFYFVQPEKAYYVNGDNCCMEDEDNNMDLSSFTSVHFMVYFTRQSSKMMNRNT